MTHARGSCNIIQRPRNWRDLVQSDCKSEIESGQNSLLAISGSHTDDIPINEQWQVVANARQIVAIHGEALAAIVSDRRGLARRHGDLGGVQVIELFGPGHQVDYYRRCAAVMNAHWCGCARQDHTRSRARS